MTNQFQQELKAKLKEGIKPSDIKKMGAFVPQPEPIKSLNHLNTNQPLSQQKKPINPQPIKAKEPFNPWFLFGISLLGYLLIG